jgi:hypothetical protein
MEKKNDYGVYFLKLDAAEIHVVAIQVKMDSLQRDLESARKGVDHAKQEIAKVASPFVQKIVQNLREKDVELFNDMHLDLIETYLNLDEDKKYLACKSLRDILTWEGEKVLGKLQSSQQDETSQQIQRDIQSFCEIFGVTLLPGNSSQPTWSSTQTADMNEPSINARLDALRHLGVLFSWKKDYTCRLKIDWHENTTAFHGGSTADYNVDKSQLVDVEWNKGTFVQELEKIKSRWTWSSIRYNRTQYFDQDKNKDHLLALQSKLEGEKERGVIYLLLN